MYLYASFLSLPTNKPAALISPRITSSTSSSSSFPHTHTQTCNSSTPVLITTRRPTATIQKTHTPHSTHHSRVTRNDVKYLLRNEYYMMYHQVIKLLTSLVLHVPRPASSCFLSCPSSRVIHLFYHTLPNMPSDRASSLELYGVASGTFFFSCASKITFPTHNCGRQRPWSLGFR